MMKVRVEGHPHLYKDTENGLITQESILDRERYRRAKHNIMMQESMRTEVEYLKKDVQDIKQSIDSILKILTLNSK
jgi:hypothetical protein